MRLSLVVGLVLVLGGCGPSTENKTPETPVATDPAAPVTETPATDASANPSTPELPVEEVPTTPEPQPEPGPALGPVSALGAAITDDSEVVPLEQLVDAAMKSPETFDSSKVWTTSGVVRQACQIRGCWMEVRPQDDRFAEATLTVRFQNYAFFVPLDSRGSHARMQGNLRIQQLTAEQVEYYESEGHHFAKKDENGGVVIATFMASGVELRRVVTE